MGHRTGSSRGSSWDRKGDEYHSRGKTGRMGYRRTDVLVFALPQCPRADATPLPNLPILSRKRYYSPFLGRRRFLQMLVYGIAAPSACAVVWTVNARAAASETLPEASRARTSNR